MHRLCQRGAWCTIISMEKTEKAELDKAFAEINLVEFPKERSLPTFYPAIVNSYRIRLHCRLMIISRYVFIMVMEKVHAGEARLLEKAHVPAERPPMQQHNVQLALQVRPAAQGCPAGVQLVQLSTSHFACWALAFGWCMFGLAARPGSGLACKFSNVGFRRRECSAH